MVAASDGYVVSLCDYSGNMVRPWVENGFKAILVDPLHDHSPKEPGITKLAMTVEEASLILAGIQRTDGIAIVFSFPPCTDLATSGSRWWDEKRASDPHFQSKAAVVAEQCRTIGRFSGAPWMVENPRSALASIWGPAPFSFDPWQFTGFCANDNYTKKTFLWAGNGFEMPEPNPDTSLPEPDNRIANAPDSLGRADFRSVTPVGFAIATYLANT